MAKQASFADDSNLYCYMGLIHSMCGSSTVLRMMYSNCTVLDSAVLVVRRTMLIDLLARKWKEIFVRKSKVGKACAKLETGKSSMQCWKEQWNDMKGRYHSSVISEEEELLC